MNSESSEVPYADALEQFLRGFRPLIPRAVPLRDALGCAIAEDIYDEQTQQRLIDAWSVLRAGHIGVLAGLGRETVSIVPRPRVAVLSGGDIAAGNQAVVRSMCERAGASVVAEITIGEDASAISEWINGVAQVCDLIVVTADQDGATGEVLRTEGRAMTWRTATIPSSTVSFARVAQTPVAGVPAEPAAALLSMHVFVQRALRVMAALPREPVRARASFAGDPAVPAGQAALVPVRIEGDTATPVSGGQPTLADLAGADGLLVIGNGAETGAIEYLG